MKGERGRGERVVRHPKCEDLGLALGFKRKDVSKAVFP